MFAQMQEKSQAQFAQMLAFFQKSENSQKAQQQHVHGKGSSKASKAPQVREAEDEDEEDDEEGRPKKLKVPFASLSGSSAMATLD